jgi:branched-chain amino acid transport system substrate-binding protein
MFKRYLLGALLFSLVLGVFPGCGPAGYLFPPTTPTASPRQAEENLFLQAQESYRRQHYRKARMEFGSYLQLYPKGEHALLARLREAELVGLLGDWYDSLRRYQALLALEPPGEMALKARYGVGRAYFKLGQYQQASQVLENLTAVELPVSLRFSTQALLTEIALKQGRLSQAFARLRLAAQDLSGGDKEWFQDLKTRLVEQATPQELENLAELYRDSPLSAVLLLRLYTLAQKAGHREEARKWASTLEKRFPESPEAASLGKLPGGPKRLVGCLLPLSGEFGNFGRHVRQGMELAARGTSLELMFRDTPNNPQAAGQLVRDLAQDPKVLAILGPLRSGPVEGAAQAAQEAQVPIITLSQKGGITQAGDLVFQACLTPRQQVRALFQHALGQKGLKRFAVLYPDSAYGQTFMKQFLEEAVAQGVEVVTQEPYAPGTRDFATALANLKAAWRPDQGPRKFEALFIPDDPAMVAAVAGQLPAYGLNGLQLLGTNLLHVSNLPEDQARALEGILFPDAFFARDPAAAVQDYIAAYSQQYGEVPDYLATQGYVVVRLLQKMLDVNKDLKRQDVPRLLLTLKEFPEIPWFKGFNPDREEELSLYILTFKDGSVQLAQ